MSNSPGSEAYNNSPSIPEKELLKIPLSKVIDKIQGDRLTYDPVARAEVYGVIQDGFLDQTAGFHDPYPLDNRSRTRLLDASRRNLESLAAIDPSTLTTKDRLLFKRTMWDVADTERALAVSTAHFRPIDHTSLSTPQVFLRDAQGEGRFRFDQDPGEAYHFLQQMRGFPQWIDLALQNMAWAMNLPINESQPRIVMQQVIKQFDIFRPANESLALEMLLTPLKQAGGAAQVWAEEYETVAREQVIPAFRHLLQFTEDNLNLFRDNDRIGLCHLKTGKEQYQYYLDHYSTTNSFNLIEYRQYVIARFSKRVGELREIQAGFPEFAGRTLKEFLEYALHQAWPPHSSAAALEQEYNDTDNYIKAHMHLLFNQLPKSDFAIIVDQSPSAEMAFPRYLHPTLDNDYQGRFIVPIYDPERYVRPRILKNSFHEGRPGHDIQMALQLGQADLHPYFRHRLDCHAFQEGWGKYSETLAADIGITEDIWQYIARLETEIHELRMILLDFGINYEEWTLERAKAEQRKLLGDEPREILRVITMPGQSIVYQVGLEVFLGLRKYAEQQLGERFSLPKFHDAILENGSMPLQIFVELMIAWIEAEAGRSNQIVAR